MSDGWQIYCDHDKPICPACERETISPPQAYGIWVKGSSYTSQSEGWLILSWGHVPILFWTTSKIVAEAQCAKANLDKPWLAGEVRPFEE